MHIGAGSRTEARLLFAKILNSRHINQPIDFFVDQACGLFNYRAVLDNHVNSLAHFDESRVFAAGEIRMQNPRGPRLPIVGLSIPAIEGERDPLISFGEVALEIRLCDFGAVVEGDELRSDFLEVHFAFLRLCFPFGTHIFALNEGNSKCILRHKLHKYGAEELCSLFAEMTCYFSVLE